MSQKLVETQAQVDEVLDIMRINVEKVMERDGKLSELDSRADALRSGALKFEKESKNVSRKFWWKNFKMWLILGGVILIIVLPVLGWLIYHLISGSETKSRSTTSFSSETSPRMRTSN